MVYYDPLKLTEAVRKIVVRSEGEVELRKYYRFRGGRWYGGIATADSVGCNLRCRFCWSWRPRDNMSRYGRFYAPKEVYMRLISIASKRGYRQLRVSGGEPTIGRKHLLQLLELLEGTNYLFILETNGILLGAQRDYAKELSKFKNIHVRVSLKGCTPEEFAKLTGAKPEAFNLQLNALKNLVDYGVSTHPAVMLSFSSKESLEMLVEKLREIDNELVEELEPEYVFLYPHVIELLKRHGLKPRIAYSPNNIPEELI
ncbi:MAG: molybdenum cofactor biosynthesis protein MoaA [Thermoprotei archaeon]|nr:MAG: molybdenum cofactor biosynthesis protein MoaA [Thermoprotei archaeon]